jgi:hypothetical protein
MDSSTSTPKEDIVFNEENMSSSSTINWLRGPKLNGIAAFDLVATAMGAFILSGAIKLLDRFNGYTHVLVIFILLIILAIGVHYAMEIPTMMNHYLNINTLEEVTEGRNSRGEH